MCYRVARRDRIRGKSKRESGNEARIDGKSDRTCASQSACLVPLADTGFQAAHLCLLLFSSVFTGIFLKQHRLALLAHCALTVAFLIYVPAAFTLTLMKGRNAFDHAGGEIAYLVIQQIGLSGEFSCRFLVVRDTN